MNSTRLVIGLSLVLGLLPLVFYAVVIGRAPQIHAAEALEMLASSGADTILVDVRLLEAYQERHIAGAFSLPLAEILALDTAKDLPTVLRGDRLLLVCDSGLLSTQAAFQIRRLGVEAYSVRGGMQDWGRAWPEHKNSPFSRFVFEGMVIQEPFQPMSNGEQAAAAMALLWVKPTYMILSGLVSFLLLRSQASDLRLLGWGLAVFLIGEIFCAINYLLLADNSYFAEYVHSYSMVIAFGLAVYSLLEGLDQRIIHFSQADRQCAMLPVCGPCAKYQPVRCGLRRIAQLACVAMILLAFIPMLAPFSYTAYNTLIGIFDHYYVRPFVQQWFEARYCPGVGMLLFCLALLVMQFNPQTTLPLQARIFICGGAGFFGFALFRVALGMIYAEALVWSIFWEELTELMFVSAVIYILWVFQRTLLTQPLFPWKRGTRLVTNHK